jgi:hypothetical protein
MDSIVRRDLDGIYFSVIRNDRYESLCFSDLTEDEMNTVMEGRSEVWLKSMCVLLGKCIREIGDTFDLVCCNKDEDIDISDSRIKECALYKEADECGKYATCKMCSANAI